MSVDDVICTAEAMGRQATDMIQALKGVEAPSRENPLSGVACSALARCQQIAEQISYLSVEAIGQMRTFESSEKRGRKLAEARASAKKRRSNKMGPTASKQVSAPAARDEHEEEEDLWNDEL